MPDLSPDPFERSQVQDLAALEVDAVDPPVFITIAILQVEDMLVGVGPAVGPDATIGVIGNRLCILRRVCRAHPDVQDAIFGGQKAQAGAIWAESGADSVRIAKEGISGNQLGLPFCRASKGEHDEKYDQNYDSF